MPLRGWSRNGLSDIARPGSRRIRPVSALGRAGLVQVHHLGARGLLQDKLIVGERLVDLQLHHGQDNGVFLLRAPDLDDRGEFKTVVIPKVAVTGISGHVAVVVVHDLAIGFQVGTVENDFALQVPAFAVLGDDVEFVVRLLHPFVSFGVLNFLVAIFQDSNIFGADLAEQERVVDLLWADVLQGLVGGKHNVIAANNELIFDRDPQFESFAIADHVEGTVADDGHEADHAQHVGFAHQHIAANLLVFGDLALDLAADGGVNVHGGIEGVNHIRARIDTVRQFVTGGGEQLGGADTVLDLAGTEKAAAQRDGCEEEQQKTSASRKSHEEEFGDSES